MAAAAVPVHEYILAPPPFYNPVDFLPAAADDETPNAVGAVRYTASHPPPLAKQVVSAQLDPAMMERLVGQGLVAAGRTPIDFPVDGGRASWLTLAIGSEYSVMKEGCAADYSASMLAPLVQDLAKAQFSSETMRLMLQPTAEPTSQRTRRGDRTFAVGVDVDGVPTQCTVQFCIEARAPQALLDLSESMGQGAIPLDAAKEAVGRDAMLLQIADHLLSANARFGILWGAFFFIVVELAHLPQGGLTLLVSPVLSSFDRPQSSLAPPTSLPPPAPLVAALLAIFGHALGAVSIPDSPLVPAAPGPGPRQPRQTPLGVPAVALGSVSGGLFAIEAIVQPKTATVEYADAALFDTRPRSLIGVRFNAKRQVPTPERDAKSAFSFEIDGDTEEFLSAPAEDNDEESSSFCPLLQVPDVGQPSIQITLHDKIGQGRTSVVYRASATAIDTGRPIAGVPLVAKLIEYDHFLSAAREELFYTSVRANSSPVQALLPEYFGAFIRAEGSWVIMLLEDVGALPKSEDEEVCEEWDDEQLEDDSDHDSQLARKAFDDLCTQGIEHGDRCKPHVGQKDGRVRVFGLGQARLVSNR